MRQSAMALLLSLAAAAAMAQPSPPHQPDFSRPTLVRILSNAPEPPHEPNITYHVGSVEFRALTTRWRIAYLPIMAPLSGSFNRGRGFGASLPDPFLLTGTEIPQTARTWRDMRTMSNELKRIEQSERARAKIRVSVGQRP